MKEEMEAPIKDYLNYSFSGNLNPRINFERVEKPKVSIIIPMYNEEKKCS
jgi:cellulose synthase/poly-beta-1,6-N-acetylglucosamine synthase-like glycosyltransferase